MLKKFKNYSMFVILLILFPLNVLAYYDYEITSYNVDITVYENNVLNIVETIDVLFNEDKHGIYRKIPLVNEVKRNDGTTDTIYASVSNIDINYNYSSYTQNSYKVYQIGSSGYTVSGEHTYVISYNYKLSKDTSNEFDELYLNIIGTEWDTTIDDISFTISMPKEFDESLLGFSQGSYGSVGYSSITYNVDNNVITGYSWDKLKPGEGITVRLELPEGYFVTTYSIWIYIDFIIIFLSILICINLWFKYGKGDKCVETVEFYPPEGLNSLEVGFVYKGVADSNDASSLLVYLASKGYIEIEEIKSKSIFSAGTNYNIIKLKEYDGDNTIEELFFRGLFKNQGRATIDPNNPKKTSVKLSELNNVFYRTINSVVSKMNDKINKEKIFTDVPFNSKLMYLSITAFLFIITNIVIVGGTSSFEDMIISTVFPGIAIIIFCAMVPGNKNPRVLSLFVCLWCFGFGGIPWIMMVLPYLKISTVYAILYTFVVVAMLIIVKLSSNFKKRNEYGNEVLGKILGFRTYLLKVEKEKLESMVLHDPDYFYNILPYAYVLGVSDKWIKKFETMNLQNPNWYSGTTHFNFRTFNTVATKNLATTPSSSSSSGGGGGFSGGGSSGGGSGGGGGGSW